MTERNSGARGSACVQGPGVGLDLARGMALLGLMAAGVFHAALGNDPSALGPISAGDCPAVTFALVGGATLALAAGGSRIPEGRHHASACADVGVRTALIAVIGLALGLCGTAPVLLPYYGVLCLLSIIFLGRRPWLLTRIATVVLLVAPAIVTSTIDRTTPRPDGNPSFSTLVTDPSGSLIDLFITGFYPVLVYLAYTCAGLAIGRMDLASLQLIRKLLIGGVGIVAVSWLWWLAFPASRSHGWVYLIGSINSLGSAIVMVAAALLLVRAPMIELLLRPVALAGTMALTLYTGYVLVLATGVLGISPAMQYPVLLIASFLFALLWRRFRADGPLEWLAAQLSRRARHAVLGAEQQE
jgi:Protein of unknown function (DUF418)